jgi:hypothetical protein
VRWRQNLVLGLTVITLAACGGNPPAPHSPPAPATWTVFRHLPGVVDLVADALDSEDPRLVMLALRDLAKRHDPALESRFAAVALRNEPKTRREAVYALLRLGTPGAAGELRALAKHGPDEVSALALNALSPMGSHCCWAHGWTLQRPIQNHP